MWYCPAAFAESMVAFPHGEKFALYPGAVESWKARENDPAKRWQTVIEFSNRFAPIEIAKTLDGANCPVPASIRKHLTEFLLTRDTPRRV
jgi:hypothetical protein